MHAKLTDATQVSNICRCPAELAAYELAHLRASGWFFPRMTTCINSFLYVVPWERVKISHPEGYIVGLLMELCGITSREVLDL